MALADIVSIDDAVQKIIELSRPIEHKPVVTGVYGLPNHGKSFFMKKFQQDYHDPLNPYAVWFSQGPESLDHFEDATYYLFQVAQSPNDLITAEGFNLEFQDATGRNVDLHVLILNPTMYNANVQRCREIYDLIIENPNSVKKML